MTRTENESANAFLNGGNQGAAVVVAPIQNNNCKSGTGSFSRDFTKAVIPKGRSEAKPPPPRYARIRERPIRSNRIFF